MKSIFAYYASVPGSNQEEQFSRANYWKLSWELAGWKASMLNRTHAQVSPYYSKMQRKVADTITGTTLQEVAFKELLSSRLVRWCALHAAKGGWMSHYDVVNLGFTPEMATEIETKAPIQLTEGNPHLAYIAENCVAQMMDRLLAEQLVENGKLIDEYKILNINSILKNLPIKHVSKSEIKKSDEMKFLCESLKK